MMTASAAAEPVERHRGEAARRSEIDRVERLSEQGALATADLAYATDILWTLNHPSVWQLLVHHRGWSAQQYESWLGDILCSQLLTVHAQREPGQPRRNTTFPPP